MKKGEILGHEIPREGTSESPISLAEVPFREIGTYIPPGTFHAPSDDELTGERVRAIQLVEQKGRWLIDNEGARIIQLYRTNPLCTGLDIALQVFPPEEVRKFPVVYRTAVSWALRRLLPKEEMDEITRHHWEEQLRSRVDFSSQEFIRQCKQAAKRRHELHGVDTEAMIRARGRVPWSLAEKAMLNDLVNNPGFKRNRPGGKETLDYEGIAAELNRLFHEDKQVRYANSVRSIIADSRRPNKQK